jgi:hypothetical protein
MCKFKSPKMPPIPKPIQPMQRESAEMIADRAFRKRRSVADGYTNWAFSTSPSGVSDFGKAAQVPQLSSGDAASLGV